MSSLSTTSSPRTSLETTKSFKSTSTKSLISSSDSSLPHRTKQPSKTRKMWESLKRRTSFPLQNSKQAAPVQIGGPKRALTWQRPRSRKVGAISREMNNQYVN